MRYQELEATIQQWVAEASESDLRNFGAATVTHLAGNESLLDFAAGDELDESAWAALTAARATAVTATAAELRAQLARIEEGILSDGDMDPGLLTVISALEHWTTYLEQGERDELYELAIRSIEWVDFEVSAALDDFLAEPAMAAEYERIKLLLGA